MNEKIIVSSPQARWQHFRDTRLPKLSRRQRWSLVGLAVFIMLLFCLIVLPFILPLAGPKAVTATTLADDNGHFVELLNTNIYYQHAPAEGETVILIHGQAGSTLSWQATMSALQNAGYNTYALDLPGYGLSEKGLQLDFSHEFAAALVLEFMQLHEIEQAHFVGHAYGSNVAVWVAMDAPQQVSSLVLVAPTLITWETPQVSESLLNTFFVKRWIRVGVRLVGPAAVEEQLRSATKIDDVVTPALVDDYSRLMQTADWDLTAIGVIRDSYRNTLPQALNVVEQPVLLLWGTEDGWAPPDAADGMLEKLPTATLHEFKGIGHLVMHEAAADFNAVLINFFDND